MRYATLVFILLIVLAMFSSCRTTRYVPLESVRTEWREADTTVIYNRLLKIFESRKEKETKSDSLVDRTKETVVLNEKGDTTRHDKEHTVYKTTSREKELETENKTLRDSLSKVNTRLESIKVDSIPVPYPVEVPVVRERNRRWWETSLIWTGGITIGFLALFLWWKWRKR